MGPGSGEPALPALLLQGGKKKRGGVLVVSSIHTCAHSWKHTHIMGVIKKKKTKKNTGPDARVNWVSVEDIGALAAALLLRALGAMDEGGGEPVFEVRCSRAYEGSSICVDVMGA